jgi:hypothetical protein
VSSNCLERPAIALIRLTFLAGSRGLSSIILPLSPTTRFLALLYKEFNGFSGADLDQDIVGLLVLD